MRNKYPGKCYRCGLRVAAGEGHFERHMGSWRTIHANCVFQQRDEKQMTKESEMNTYEQRQREIKAQKALKRLAALPGMQALKEQVEQIIQFAKVSKLREQHGLKAKSHSNHMVFTGSPGTGKTTAARLIGKAFAALGLLQSDSDDIPFVEVIHSDISAKHIGESENNMKAKFIEAKGGVLFLDEAYSFVGEHEVHGQVIATMIQMMEDMRDSVMLIAAGYPKEMEDFLRSNPGMRSRISNTIHFPDYSTDDMLQIATFMCTEMDYTMSDSFISRLTDRLEQEKRRPGFGNARTVRNIIEQSIKRQSVRISKSVRPQRSDLITLVGSDMQDLPVQAAKPSEKMELNRKLQAIQERLQEIEIEEMLS